jgi:hypothetical protein
LSIKGGPGHGSGEGKKGGAEGQKGSKEANIGFRERSVQTYKIYIL